MLRLLAVAAVLGLSSAQWMNYHPYQQWAGAGYREAPVYRGYENSWQSVRGCAFVRKPRDTASCRYVDRRDGRNCVIAYDCEEKEAAPKPCPQAPARPEGVKGCNWIPIMDNRNCILDYECEPKGPEPCPSTPMQPEDSTRCRWTALKNHKGCVIDYECEPRRAVPSFNVQPYAQAQALPYAHANVLPYAQHAYGGFPYGLNLAVRQAQFAQARNVYNPYF